jgi:hypothetical protein
MPSMSGGAANGYMKHCSADHSDLQISLLSSVRYTSCVVVCVVYDVVELASDC